MNVPTLLVLAVILALFVLCLVRLRKKGSCDCGSSGDDGCPSCAGCNHHCHDEKAPHA